MQAALQPFATQTQMVGVVYESLDPEATALANQLAAILVAAHWSVYGNRAVMMHSDQSRPGQTGILIESADVTNKAANALVKSLRSAGWPSGGHL